MADDHNYSLVEPFGIDHGELDGLTPQEVFTLGVEWQLFRGQLEHPDVEAFQFQAHTANAERLKAMCKRHGREVKQCWLHEDYAEWCVLHVSDAAK